MVAVIATRKLDSAGRRGGFVLLEAVVALAIIGLVAIAVLGTTAAQVRTADKAQLLLTARALAEDRLATLRSLDYYDLRDLPDSLAAGTFPEPFTAYTWQMEVAPVDDEYDLFTAGVVVMVGDDAFPLHTLLHEPQPQLDGGAIQFDANPIEMAPPSPPPPPSR